MYLIHYNSECKLKYWLNQKERIITIFENLILSQCCNSLFESTIVYI